jgi:hypothetical protein
MFNLSASDAKKQRLETRHELALRLLNEMRVIVPSKMVARLTKHKFIGKSL